MVNFGRDRRLLLMLLAVLILSDDSIILIDVMFSLERVSFFSCVELSLSKVEANDQKIAIIAIKK